MLLEIKNLHATVEGTEIFSNRPSEGDYLDISVKANIGKKAIKKTEGY